MTTHSPAWHLVWARACESMAGDRTEADLAGAVRYADWYMESPVGRREVAVAELQAEVDAVGRALVERLAAVFRFVERLAWWRR